MTDRNAAPAPPRRVPSRSLAPVSPSSPTMSPDAASPIAPAHGTLTKRMSWLFSSPWHEAQHATTVSAPGRADIPFASQRRRRGTSASSIGSVSSVTAGLPLERSSDAAAPSNPRSRNPEEYAVETLFTRFSLIADTKLQWALNFSLSEDPDLATQLRAGADATFDAVLHNLGSLARQRPKSVVDALMIWRRSKSDPPPDVATLRQAAKGEPISKEVLAIVRERNSLVSIFILCRALIEVIKQTRSDLLPNDLAVKLEEMVFNQLRTADPILIARSPNRTAIMTLFAELIGWMSNVRFASVSDRFIAELEKLPFAISDAVDSRDNRRIEMIIRAMRFLKLKIYPEPALEETSEFFQSIAKFFSRVKSVKVKHAYAELFIELLMPIAGVAVAEVNYPNWAQGVESIFPRALKMSTKPKHWLVAYPLLTALLAVSRREFFHDKWLAVLDSAMLRLKDKAMRPLVLACSARLLWVYLYRCSESTAQSEKRIEPILKSLFPPGRRQLNPADVELNHFVRIVHLTSLRDPDHAMKALILPLLGVEPITNIIVSNTIDTLAPERATIALRSIMLTLRDLEMGLTKPTFPPVQELLRHAGAIAPDAMEYSAEQLPESLLARKLVASIVDRISESLGRLLSILDGVHGMQVLLDDRYLSHRNMYSISTTAASATKEHAVGTNSEAAVQTYTHLATLTVSYPRDRQPFFELLRNCASMIPRCMPSGITLPKLCEMLTRYLVHVDQDLARTAAEALKRLARWRRSAHLVVVAMSKLMIRLNDRFSEILYAAFVDAQPSAGPKPRIRRSGLLKLYVNLLEIWCEQLGQQAPPFVEKNDSPDSADFDAASMWNLIAETEGIGLFLLCGHSPAIRRCALMVLKLAAAIEARFDAASRAEQLPTSNPHLINLLDGTGNDLVAWKRDIMVTLGLPAISLLDTEVVASDRDHPFWRSRAKLKQLAESENPLNSRLWGQLFPHLIFVVKDRFPITAALSKTIVCDRLVQMHPLVLWAADLGANGVLVSQSTAPKKAQVVSMDFIDQWAVYLRFACATITDSSEYSDSKKTTSPHRKRTRSSSGFTSSLSSAAELFRMTLQLLSSDNMAVREAVVLAMASVNHNTYCLLIEELTVLTTQIESPFKRPGASGMFKRSKSLEALRCDLTSIFRQTVDLLMINGIRPRHDVFSAMAAWLTEMRAFLEEAEVAGISIEFQRMREEFAGFAGRLHLVTLSGEYTPLALDVRASLWLLLANWCGVPVTRNATEQLGSDPSRWTLEHAALRAMADLCRGPLALIDPSTDYDGTFTLAGLLAWIDSVFGNSDKQVQSIAELALQAILEHNWQTGAIDAFILHCYAGHPLAASTASFFSCLVEFAAGPYGQRISENALLVLALFKSGNSSYNSRKQALSLLKMVEERGAIQPVAGDELALLSELPSVFSAAQVNLSVKFSRSWAQKTYQVLSEMIYRMDVIPPSVNRDMLGILRPWLGNVVLAVDESRPSGLNIFSEIILSNMFYLTVRFGDELFRELELLWAEVIQGNAYGNCKIITDFLLDIAMEKRSAGVITHAKKVIVYLGRSSGCSGMLEAALSAMTPKQMIPEARSRCDLRAEDPLGLYIAEVDPYFVHFAKRTLFSRGQLALAFLADFAVENGPALLPQLATILHSAVIQIESAASTVADQLRMLLTNLVYSVFVAKLGNDALVVSQSRSLISLLLTYTRKPGRKVNDRDADEAFEDLILGIAELFSSVNPEIAQNWGEAALHYATQCPVRDLASASFRVFRALRPEFSQSMLAEILARLSNTISDSAEEIQDFAVEILTTLRILTIPLAERDLLAHPQVIWACIALMYTRNQAEYQLAVDLLEVTLSKIDLDDVRTQEIVTASFPTAWNAEFDGIQPLLLKGLRSTSTEPQCLQLINSLLQTDGGSVVDPSESRGLFLILCNLPRIVSALDDPELSGDIIAVAGQLMEFCEHYELVRLRKIMESFNKRRFRGKDDFLKQMMLGLKDVFFPEFEWDAVVFVSSLLNNQESWMRLAVFSILRAMLPHVNLGCDEYKTRNHELIVAPLLGQLAGEFGDDALEILEATMLPSGGAKAVTDGAVVDEQRPCVGPKNSDYTPSTVSGWFVGSDPDQATIQTRQNVHAVLLTCAGAGQVAADAAETGGVLATLQDFAAYENDRDRDSMSDMTTFSRAFTLGHHRGWSTAAGAIDDVASLVLPLGGEHAIPLGISDDETGSNDSEPLEDLVARLDDLEDFFATEAGMQEE